MKKVISILLAALMISVSLPVAFAASVQAPYWGDLNGDHKANFSDILILNKIRLGKIEGTPEQICFGDVDLNGVSQGLYNESAGITEENIATNSFGDILTINKYRLGKISSFPAESLAKITFNPPKKQGYNVGDTLNTEGMSVVIKNKNNSDVKYTLTDNISVSGFNSSSPGEKTLTATFRGMSFSFNVYVSSQLSYSANGGSFSLSGTLSNTGYFTITSKKPTRSGYVFMGWSKNKNATSASYQPGDQIYAPTDTTLYAVWKAAHTVTYNYSYNGGTSATIESATVAEGAAIDLTPTATKRGWTFVGWNTSSSATTGLSSKTMGTGNVTLYAIYKKTLTGTFIDYSGTAKKTTSKTVDIYNKATSGTLTSPTQNTYTGWTKRGWTTGTAADASTTTNYTISKDTTFYGTYQRTLTLSYDAEGGSPTPSSQTGKQYVNSYDINTKKDPSFKLADAPEKPGYKFKKWTMGKSSVTNMGVIGALPFDPGSNITISKDTTMYATWTPDADNIYNLGEETYSFENYGDEDSFGGHCFGMAVTSSGYYLGTLSKAIIGGNDGMALYSFSDTAIVRKPICYYFHNQGEDAEYPSMVAGGRINLEYETIDWDHITTSAMKRIAKNDWNECVNHVRDHNLDNKGTLNIGMYYYDEFDEQLYCGGHQVNFLYYKEVDGQQRLYAYDNNLPEYEVYFYLGSDGFIHEDSDESINEEWAWLYDLIKEDQITGFDLMDVESFFQLAPQFDIKQYIYAREGEIIVKGAKKHRMKCGHGTGNYVMFKVPDGTKEVTIKPLVKNASFYYDDSTRSFGAINEKTYAKLGLAADYTPGFVGGSSSSQVTFTIYNAPDEKTDKPTNPTQPQQSSGSCKYCGGEHTGLFGWLIKIIHNILFSIFGAKK